MDPVLSGLFEGPILGNFRDVSLGNSSGQDALLGGEKRKAEMKRAGVGRSERVTHQA